MKIAMPVDGENMESMICNSFGRAKKFLVADSETLEYELIENAQNLNAPQGAGIQSAQNMAEAGAKAVITFHLGPKAFRVLSGAGIKIYTGIKSSAKKISKHTKKVNLLR